MMINNKFVDPDYTIEYSQLNDPNKDDNTFLNNLFDLGDDYEKRTPFFINNKKKRDLD
jgi:hypothetical protein